MLNIGLTYDLAIPLLGIFQRDMETDVHVKTCTWIFSVVLFVVAKIKTKQMTTKWWMGKPKMIYAYNRILFSKKKKGGVLMCVLIWINFEIIMLSETSESKKNTCCMIPLLLHVHNTQINNGQ